MHIKAFKRLKMANKRLTQCRYKPTTAGNTARQAGGTKQTTDLTQEPRPKTAPEPQEFYRQIAANSKNSQKLGAKIRKYFFGFSDIASGGTGVQNSLPIFLKKKIIFKKSQISVSKN